VYLKNHKEFLFKCKIFSSIDFNKDSGVNKSLHHSIIIFLYVFKYCLNVFSLFDVD